MNSNLQSMAQELFPDENWGQEKDVANNIERHKDTVEGNEINTHHLILTFGKHKGKLITRVPVSYLQWMVNEMDGYRKQLAEAELQRRGTTNPEIEVSGHAIDRASLTCRSIWYETSRKKQGSEGGNKNIIEGISSWLSRISKQAYDKNDTDVQGRYVHLGMKFVIEKKDGWPIVKTVMRQ